MKNLSIVLFILVIFSLSCNEQNRFVYVEDGRLYDPEGKELSAYGVNLQPNLSWEYNGLLKRAGVPKTAEALKKATDESLDELEILNCKTIRCHLTPGDFTDNMGNLVETIYLDMLDYLVAESWKRGMYVNIAFINHMGQNDEVENSFMNSSEDRFDYRAAWILDEEMVEKSKHYIQNLLNRVNPYTDISYKEEPGIAVLEVMNEPRYYDYETFVTTPFKEKYKNWLEKNDLEDIETNYYKYRKEVVRSYINEMYDNIRETGDKHPVVWNCNWNRMIMGHEDVFEAIAQTKVEVVSFCNYPGQNVVKAPYQKNPEDLSRYDFTEWYQNFYSNPDYYGWVRSEEFSDKAKIVYEFETFYNQSAYLYPAQADFLRAMGVQMAGMWNYSMPAYAQNRSGSHVLNLKVTPRKAAAFAVAGKIFEHLPLYHEYHVESPITWKTDTYMYSYENDMSLYSDDKYYYYSNAVPDSISIKPKPTVEEIFGYGNSPLVKYNGTGNYKILISENHMDVIIQPDVKYNMELWQRGRIPDGGVTEFIFDNLNKMTLEIEGWGKGNYVLHKQENGEKTKVQELELLEFEITPGTYRIEKV